MGHHLSREFHARKVLMVAPTYRIDKFRLQHYILQNHPMDDVCNLPERQCLKAFLHWTANIRPALPETSKERLMCPMLWCRRGTFEDIHSLMRHVKSCSWLSNYWYWCPRCSRPERFIGRSSMHVTGPNHTLQSKTSKLRKAVAFFKHLGRRSLVRKQNASLTPRLELDTDGWSGKNPYKTCEMSDTSSVFSPQISEIGDAEKYEMNSHMGVLEMESDLGTALSELCSGEPTCAELNCSHHCEPTATHDTLEDRETVTSISVVPGSEDALEMKFSDNPIHDTSERREIEKLRRFFCVVKFEWQARLALPSIYSRYTTRGLFEMGIKTLKCWSQTNPPTSFDSVFALMHLACACVYLMHPDDHFFRWDDFFEDMLHWQLAIPNQQEKFVFRRIVKVLHSYQGSSKAAVEISYHPDANSTGGLLRTMNRGRIIQVLSDFLSRKTDQSNNQ